VRPLDLGDGTFDNHVIYFSIIVSALPLGVKVCIRTTGNCKSCAMSWEGFTLLLGYLGLWWRLWWWVGFLFDLRVVVLHWVGDLWSCWGVCNLWSWHRVCYLQRWQMLQVVSCGIMIRLIVCRMWCLISLVDLWQKKANDKMVSIAGGEGSIT
jgi:hypothetical protein